MINLNNTKINIKINVINYQEPKEYDSNSDEEGLEIWEYVQGLNERLKRIFCDNHKFNELKEKFNILAEYTFKNRNLSEKAENLIYLINLQAEKLIEACEFHFLNISGDKRFLTIKNPEFIENKAALIIETLNELPQNDKPPAAAVCG